ncbi:hypothetical protein [Hornefia butyriciproducens]|uniref:hypothetical protein n=1 Tax=Hornefia butyriciproducens TaxID=2652293 RepID=UPI002A918390|nr:hypothetical protein [Hornefia butyriciproducens]MDY5463302.1 hypothetical protein [Hornefia butyriciproducens]
MKKRSVWSIIVLVTICLILSQFFVYAGSENSGEKYYFDKFYKIDRNKGFSLDEKKKIKEKDVHYGWRLGSLYVSGYTQRTEDTNGNPVFLKNSGDKVVLGFRLEQNIDKLNGDKTLSVAEDKKGYDDYFQIKKTNFKRGALIVRHTDYQNSQKEPQIYTDYLSADAKVNTNTVVDINEEGDYEVALDYVIKSSPRKIFGREILPSTSDYTIRLFKFSVRNGNSMVFPFDAKTGEELSNRAFTENGFRIDLAKSHYLKVFVKRDIINDEDSEDTRENKPAQDGDVYTDEGVYTITVEDPSTGQKTEKKLYVGDDDRYKAFVTTGLSLEEIDERIADGERIGDDGNFVTAKKNLSSSAGTATAKVLFTVIVVVVVILVIVCMAISRSRRKKGSWRKNSEGMSE